MCVRARRTSNARGLSPLLDCANPIGKPERRSLLLVKSATSRDEDASSRGVTRWAFKWHRAVLARAGWTLYQARVSISVNDQLQMCFWFPQVSAKLWTASVASLQIWWLKQLSFTTATPQVAVHGFPARTRTTVLCSIKPGALTVIDA